MGRQKNILTIVERAVPSALNWPLTPQDCTGRFIRHASILYLPIALAPSRIYNEAQNNIFYLEREGSNIAYGTKSANIMDTPLSISSVVTPYLGDNGYKWEGVNSIRVLSVADGTLADYDETSATTPMGNPSLVVPSEQVLALAYNKSMLLRIQRTQIQDIPVSGFSKQVALQQANDVFVPAHDAYSLAKIFAARPAGNVQAVDTAHYALSFQQMVNKARTGGSGNMQNIIAWVTYTLSAQIQDAINYTGSDAGFTQGKNGFLGKLAGVPTVEVPDAYFFAGVSAICVDKRAIVNVTPKMDPKNGGLTVIDPVPLFSGIEIQLRDRSDTFVLNKKVNAVASLEAAGSTTTTT